MRRRSRPPLNRRYFHTQRRIDKRDMSILKMKIEDINQKKYKKDLENKEKKKLWHI